MIYVLSKVKESIAITVSNEIEEIYAIMDILAGNSCTIVIQIIPNDILIMNV